MNNSPLVSLIIRTKNEERWITSCLDAVFNQSYKSFEVILVDNESTDKTVSKARQYNVKKIVTINNYLPGKALNLGIEQSIGKQDPINRTGSSQSCRHRIRVHQHDGQSGADAGHQVII